MRQPVRTVIPRQPLGPKPEWRDLFVEPVYLPAVLVDGADDDEPLDDEEAQPIITP